MVHGGLSWICRRKALLSLGLTQDALGAVRQSGGNNTDCQTAMNCRCLIEGSAWVKTGCWCLESDLWHGHSFQASLEENLDVCADMGAHRVLLRGRQPQGCRPTKAFRFGVAPGGPVVCANPIRFLLNWILQHRPWAGRDIRGEWIFSSSGCKAAASRIVWLLLGCGQTCWVAHSESE